MTKLLVLALGVSCFGIGRACAEDRLNIVIAIDLMQPVATLGPDGKSDFQKNIEGVMRVLSQVPADARVMVIGITDDSFAQPYILLTAHVPDDPGYFGERLNTARDQMVRAWKLRSTHLDSHFHQTDIFGALKLAGQIFAQQSDTNRKTLVIFSDMRQSTTDLNLESLQIVPSFSVLANRCSALPDFHNVQIQVLGADGVSKSIAYWQSLHSFWGSYFRNSGAALVSYSVVRDLSVLFKLK